MRGAIAVVAMIGCGPRAATRVIAPVDAKPATATAPPRTIGRVMVPAELGDAGAIDRIPYGVRVAKIGVAWLTPASEPEDSRDQDGDISQVWPAIADAGTRIQIVSEDDDAIVALWIERADLVTVAVADIALAASPPHAGAITAAARGVVARAGAPLRATTHTDHAARVEVRDAAISAAGWIPASSLGQVFAIGRTADARDPDSSVVAGAAIRAHASSSAPAIAVTRVAVPAVTRPGAPTGWREVAIETAYVRVTGFVAAADASDHVVGEIGSGSSRGYGMSHAIRIDVPVGACLYSGIDGEVVGVNIADRTRLGRGGHVDVGWWSVAVGTAWGIHDLAVRDLASAADPGQAELELCTPEPSAP